MLSEIHPAEFEQGFIQDLGEVERSESDRIVVVSTSKGIVRAQIAFSCLVLPACGDTVLLSRRKDVNYVLAILERHKESPVEIGLKGKVSFEVQGDLSLRATNNIELDSGSCTRLNSRDVEICGETIQLAGTKVSVTARALNWLADTLESTARIIKQTSELWSAHAQTHTRQVDEMELVRAGNIDLSAKELINVGAGHMIMKSRELTKIDGKQIQVG